VADDGKVFVVELTHDNMGSFNYQVLRYSAGGIFEAQIVPPRSFDMTRGFDKLPRIEIAGPQLFLSDPLTGLVDSYDIQTGVQTGAPFADASKFGSAAFLAFANPKAPLFTVTTDNPMVTGFISPQGNLELDRPSAFAGQVAVTVRVSDGPNASHDFNGRSDEITFDVSLEHRPSFGATIAANAIYGTKFDDINEDGVQDPNEVALENVLVYLDVNNDGFDAPGSPNPDPFQLTDANGAFAFTGLDDGTFTISEVVDANLTEVVGSLNVSVSSTLSPAPPSIVIGADLSNYVELDAIAVPNGEQVLRVNEGAPVDLAAVVRRDNFTFQIVDVAPGPGQINSDPSEFVEFQGELYFAAFESSVGRELFKFDGTNAVLVADLFDGAPSGIPTDLTVFNNKLYFAAFDTTGDHELFEYDGSGTPVKLDIEPSGNSSPTNLTVHNGLLFFNTGSNPTGARLRSFDGVNTASFPAITTISQPGQFEPNEIGRASCRERVLRDV
jgi:ELWxxDGT repeat protein